MAERVFCIDVGSAYTKIALRRDPAAESELVLCPGIGIDYWIPSLIAVDRRGPKPRVAFGSEAADGTAGNGIDLYPNWKSSLFLTPAPSPGGEAPLDALLRSEELRQLATRFEVPDGQITHLRQLVTAARGLIAGPGDRPVSAEAQRQTRAAALAAHFFHWLRQQVLEACAKLPTTGLKFEEIPVRVAVPALADGGDLAAHPGCRLMREALNRAGWSLHAEQPFVTEPYSNAIGILTKGANVLRRGRIQLGDMFGKGPLITVLKDPEHYPNYRALVIDVGAFTTDFASVSITPNADTASDPHAGFRVHQRSVPFAMNDLDASFKSCPLAAEKRQWLNDTRWRDWATVQRNVFAEGKGYRVPGVGVIGGDADREAVRACMAAFTGRLAEETVLFYSGLEPAGMQELILTGGGSNIPAVREAIQTAAQGLGKEFVKTHAPDLKRGRSGAPLVDKLDERLTRGGSALGGTSIYFEKRYY